MFLKKKWLLYTTYTSVIFGKMTQQMNEIHQITWKQQLLTIWRSFSLLPWCVLLSSWYPEGVIYWHKPFISLLNTETVTLQNKQFSFRMGSQAQLSCTNSFSINILQIKFRIVNISITFLHPSVSPLSCYRKPGGEIIPNPPVLHF